MTGSRARTARYLAASGARRHARSLGSVTVLVAVLGALAMASVAAARRTEGAYPAYLAHSRASNLQVSVYNTRTQLGEGTLATLTATFASLRDVTHVGTSPTLFVAPVQGGRVPAAIRNDVDVVGSLGGEGYTVDRPVVVEGRMPDPRAADQLAASRDAAHLLHWHVGERIHLDAYTVSEVVASATFPPPSRPAVQLTATLTGIVVFANEVARDDVDRYPTSVLATPALTARLTKERGFATYSLALSHGDADVSAVEREIVRALPPFTVYQFHVTSVVAGQVERAVRPESIALTVFGAIAGAAALLLAGQALRRLAGARRAELAAWRALGADRPTMVAASSAAPILAVALGGVLAVALAVALSPVGPVGTVRVVDPSPGADPDVLVLLVVLVALVGVLSGLAVAFALGAARRASGSESDAAAGRSKVADRATRAGLPATIVTGLRFALERGSGGSASFFGPLLASSVAVLVVVTTVTFASGLSTLTSHPSLYGWNWSDAIISPSGSSVPPATGAALGRDPFVAAWAGYSYANAQMDGVTVPIVISVSSHPAVGPALLSGHGLDAPGEVVLGASTLAALHKRVGQSIVATYGTIQDAPVYVPRTPLRIVGVATLPAIGTTDSLHTSMGVGAEISASIEPPAFRAAIHVPDTNLDGPQIDVVRFRPGVAAAAAVASLQRIAARATSIMTTDPRGGGSTYQVIGPQRPAEIVIYESTGATPALLAAALAVAATVALGVALTASVRRRRRDLALLKTLGFTRRQLATAIAWQATVVAVVGVVLGVPLGIALGRWLWILFAHAIAAVPEPTVPVGEVALVAIVAVVLANVVAWVPGRAAARTPAAGVLRSE